MKIRKGIKPRPRRILLYGPEGVGKGTWAAQAPKPLFLNLEDGIDDIDCESTEKLVSIEDVMQATTWLINEKHSYKTVVVDTADWLDNLVQKRVCEDEKVKTLADIPYGRGPGKTIPIWTYLISQFEQCRLKGMAVILLSHSKVERYESPESDSYDRFVPDLNKAASPLIQEWSDEILFADFRTYTKSSDEGFNRKRTVGVGGHERYMRCQHSAAAQAKNRCDLPAELPLSWSAYADHVTKFYQGKKQTEIGNIKGIVVDGSSKKVDEEFEKEIKETF